MAYQLYEVWDLSITTSYRRDVNFDIWKGDMFETYREPVYIPKKSEFFFSCSKTTKTGCGCFQTACIL